MERAGGGSGGGGICAELGGLRSTRLLVVGDTGRGAADEAEDVTELRGECGDLCTALEDPIIAKGEAGERVCGDAEDRGCSCIWVDAMRGDRVGGVKYENEPSLSRETSEAPDDRLLDVLGIPPK